MSNEQDFEVPDEDEYDEEADSDFDEDGANDEDISESEDDDSNVTKAKRPQKRPADDSSALHDGPDLGLDSGDEATIKERKKSIRKQKSKGLKVDGDSDDNNATWRAKTRSMREREKDEKKFNKLARTEGATIDIDKVWEMMNRPGPLPPVRIEGLENAQVVGLQKDDLLTEANKENIPALINEEMITIKRQFKFAGEVHVEEKVVPKSSAEARLWLAQQEAKPQAIGDEAGAATQRPLRKISRFDPNHNNLGAFKVNWKRVSDQTDAFKGPKLNVVEKSKMDWASHVDAEGLKDELDVHAKAKEGYHSRMDFLSQVEQRKEEEARQARMKK